MQQRRSVRTALWFEQDLLPALGIFARSLGWFPLWLLLSQWRNGKAVPLWCCAVLTVGGALLMALARAEKRLRNRCRRGGAAACVCGMVPIAAGMGWLLRQPFGTVLTVLLIVWTLVAARRAAGTAPEDLFATSRFVSFLTFLTLVVVGAVVTHLPQPTLSLLLGVCGTEMVCYLLLRNQYLLLRLVNRRSATALSVPREIRMGNLWMLLLVLAGFVGLFALAPLWMRLLRAMGVGSLWLLRQIGHGIRVLLVRLGGDPPSGTASSPLPDAPAPPPASDLSPLWSLLWLLLIPVAIYIWRLLLRDVWYACTEWVHRVLHARKQRHSAQVVPAIACYDDTVTLCAPPARLRPRTVRHTWQKAYRQWRKTADSDEKFYAGYRLLTTAPGLQAALLRPSDTVREILQKCLTCGLSVPDDALTAVTGQFQTMRYAAEIMPPDALPTLTHALAELATSSARKTQARTASALHKEEHP